MKLYKVGDKITKDEYDKLQEYEKDKRLTFSNYQLKDGDKVYIDSGSNLSRNKFKKNYPTNKITYIPEEADVFIASNSIFSYVWTSMFSGPSWTTLKGPVTVEYRHLLLINKIVTRNYILRSKKPLISDSDMIYKGEIPRIMTDNEYDTIAKMMGAGDTEMMNLGVEMLLGFDHVINEKNYVLLLALAGNRWRMKKSRLFRSILKTLKTKYVNLM